MALALEGVIECQADAPGLARVIVAGGDAVGALGSPVALVAHAGIPAAPRRAPSTPPHAPPPHARLNLAPRDLKGRWGMA